MKQQPLDATAFDAAGLNLHAVFELSALPDALRAALRAEAAGRYTQLLLLGHGGPRLWAAVQAARPDSAHPIDDYTRGVVRAWAERVLAGRAWTILYPGPTRVGLQALGRLAGWHHDAPFMVGVNETWGPWFAYRALVVADSGFAPTAPMAGNSPCTRCADRPCVTACPAGALTDGRLDLACCIAHRRAEGSRCAATCLARLACPVGAEHRYPEAQIRHSYGRSLADLAKHAPGV